MIDSYPAPHIKFAWTCLINNAISTFRKEINLYISNIYPWSRDLNTYLTLGNCLFGAIKLTKNVDHEKYAYSGYGIGFNARSQFSLRDGSYDKIVVVYGVYNRSFVHIVKQKYLSSWWKTNTAEAEVKYSFDFTKLGFVLRFV